MTAARAGVVALVFGAILGVAVLSAQRSTTCTLGATVFDESRSPLAGVSVEVASDIKDDKSRWLTTDADGKVVLTDLPSATYTVTLSLPEYQTFKREGMYLAPGMSTFFATTLKAARIRD